MPFLNFLLKDYCGFGCLFMLSIKWSMILLRIVKKDRFNLTMKLPNFFIKIFFYWLPVFFWAGIIFYLSSQSGLSAGLTTPNEIIFRKVVHMLEFGILAALLMRTFHKAHGVKMPKAFFGAFILTIIYAFSDEFHQSFVSDRNGNIKDVLVDIIGAYVFLCLTIGFYGKKISFRLVLNILLAASLFLLLVFLLIQESIEIREKRLREETSFVQTIQVEERETKDSEELDNKIADDVLIEEFESEEDVAVEKKSIPESVLIDVPFSSQAPYGVWDDVHEEACEEMSLIMLKYHLDGKKLSREIAEKEIQDLKEYQLKNIGHYVDSDMEELVEIAEGYYGIKNLKVIYDFDKNELKKQLALGKPVILPTAGRLLGNPNFTQPGPLYHNLVAIGYEGNTIITNDPGTRKGEKYEYSIDVLYYAIHDFPGNKKDIEKGRKAMIVIY